MYHNFADTAMPPTLTDPVVIGTNVRISWDHTNKGPCFSNLTFSYNITWYPVVGGVPQRGGGAEGCDQTRCNRVHHHQPAEQYRLPSGVGGVHSK